MTTTASVTGKLKRNLLFVDQTDLSYHQWQAHRRSYIGGSDVATILGLNPYFSKLQLFHQKTGVATSINEESEATYSGKQLEDLIARKYWQFATKDDSSIETILVNAEKKFKPRYARRFRYLIYDPRLEWMRGNIDFFIQYSRFERKPKGILEIKSGLNWVWEQYESGIPIFYIIQIQCYLLITGLDYAEIAVLLDGRYYRQFPINRSEEIIARIVEESREFWELIQEGRTIWESDLPEYERLGKLSMIEPEVEGTAAVDRYLKERFKSEYKVGQMLITPEITDIAAQYIKWGDETKLKLDKKKTYGNTIKKILLDNKVDEIIDKDAKVVISYRKQGENDLQVLRVNRKRLNL